jgi:hypothetical protein
MPESATFPGCVEAQWRDSWQREFERCQTHQHSLRLVDRLVAAARVFSAQNTSAFDTRSHSAVTAIRPVLLG